MEISNECGPAERLHICMPCYTGMNVVETTESLINGCSLLMNEGIEFSFSYVKGNAYLDHARNVLATFFMEGRGTDILLVDADVGFDPEALLRIALAERPFIAGIYPAKCDQELWPVRFDRQTVKSDSDGLVEAVVVPTGFLRINRAVFEALGYMPYQAFSFDETKHIFRGYFQCGIMKAPEEEYAFYTGEDVEFCKRWRSKGGKIFIIPDIDFTHTGPKTFAGNWGRSMRELKSRRPPAEGVK